MNSLPLCDFERQERVRFMDVTWLLILTNTADILTGSGGNVSFANTHCAHQIPWRGQDIFMM